MARILRLIAPGGMSKKNRSSRNIYSVQGEGLLKSTFSYR